MSGLVWSLKRPASKNRQNIGLFTPLDARLRNNVASDAFGRNYPRLNHLPIVKPHVRCRVTIRNIRVTWRANTRLAALSLHQAVQAFRVSSMPLQIICYMLLRLETSHGITSTVSRTSPLSLLCLTITSKGVFMHVCLPISYVSAWPLCQSKLRLLVHLGDHSHRSIYRCEIASRMLECILFFSSETDLSKVKPEEGKET